VTERNVTKYRPQIIQSMWFAMNISLQLFQCFL